MALTDFIGADGKGRTVTPSDRLPVDIGSATVNLNGDVIAEFDGVEEALGAPADAAAAGDSSTSGLIGLVKRLLGKLPSSFQQGSGVVTSTTTRVTLATDGPGVTGINSIDGKLPALSSGAVPVTGPLTDTQLRATAVPVSAASLPLPSGAAIAANQTTANTSLSSIDTKTPALQSGAVPVGDNSGSLTVDGKAYRASVDITRPANVTAYTAMDVLGTGTGDDAIITLSGIGPSGGFVIVQSIELVLGIASVPSGMTSFRVHFHNVKPGAAADNSAFDVVSADRSKYIGYIDLPTPVDLGSTCFTQVDFPGKLFKLDTGSTSLFCELQTIGGFTPAANSEVYSLRVKTLEAGL